MTEGAFPGSHGAAAVGSSLSEPCPGAGHASRGAGELRVSSVLLYAATVFLSAFLLFQVQPLITKIVLPWFGGSAAVWSAALLFFQLLLLGGYAYAHCVMRWLPPKMVAVGHIFLLVASCVFLPILPSAALRADSNGDPTLRILWLLAVTVGLPYFALSATSPLLQAWYARRVQGQKPYRLFALSNAGSLLALLSFPVLVEPNLTSHQQAYIWSAGYIVFAALCAAAAWTTLGLSAGPFAVTMPQKAAARPSFIELLLWVALAAVPSTLLLAVTEHLTQNVVPMPFLWVLPLSIYLLTFILTFESDRPNRRPVMLALLPLALGLMAYLIYANDGNLSLSVQIPAFAFGLFTCCMACHGELARRKPATGYLTLYYLMVAVGGAVGGIFVAIIAPRLFHAYVELPVGLVACAVLMVVVLWKTRASALRPAVVQFALAASVIVFAISLVRQEVLLEVGDRVLVRNFYGSLRVVDGGLERELFHGTIRHGAQLLDNERHHRPTTYYGTSSGVGRALRALEAQGPVRVGIIGLGAGVLTSYGRPGDVYRIYEINPLVATIAQREFTFYSESRADKRILLGDARLVLERQPNQHFDLLAVDAFSGDTIPVHLLTREALALYLRHLNAHGLLAFHVTNRYLDLLPVLARNAEDLGRQATAVYDDGHEADYLSYSTWVLISANHEWVNAPSFETADLSELKASPRVHAWTDDYSNIFQAVKWGKPTVVQVHLFKVDPGRGIGPIRLGDRIGNVAAILGPETTAARLADGSVVRRWFGAPKNMGLGVRTTASGDVTAVWAIGDRRYVTQEGLHVGSAVSQVERALGRPSKVTVTQQPAIQTLWYSPRGLWFGIDNDPAHASFHTVYAIGIMSLK